MALAPKARALCLLRRVPVGACECLHHAASRPRGCATCLATSSADPHRRLYGNAHGRAPRANNKGHKKEHVVRVNLAYCTNDNIKLSPLSAPPPDITGGARRACLLRRLK